MNAEKTDEAIEETYEDMVFAALKDSPDGKTLAAIGDELHLDRKIVAYHLLTLMEKHLVEDGGYEVYVTKGRAAKRYKIGEMTHSTPTVLSQIRESIKLCQEAGYEPRLLLVNPEKHMQLMRETMDPMVHISLQHRGLIGQLYGLSVQVAPEVEDFFLVDNRSWCRQKF